MGGFWSRFGIKNKRNVANFRFRAAGDLALLNVRLAAYAEARKLAAARANLSFEQPGSVELRSKVSTQADLEAQWATFWLRELGLTFAYHRKLWELAYVMQALHRAGFIAEGRSGVGFGCGREIIPSYLAARGIDVLATDLPEDAKTATAWIETGQYAAALSDLHFAHLCTREVFDARVKWRNVDMNDVPKDLGTFDFCWSICAIEHLGTIERAIDFVENAMAHVKPGGMAVHTTEYAFLSRDRPIEKSQTVLFTRADFRVLQDRLRAGGHELAPLDFDPGDGPMDLFIDGPPYWHGEPHLPENLHMKATYNGVPTTCFGLIIRKAG
ncbi:MAG: class I SAM-dependent methyltransferase [Rhodoblastus sp.]|nr:class I SAM-dependent methyltransferase [Rhodoblastus sp.]